MNWNDVRADSSCLVHVVQSVKLGMGCVLLFVTTEKWRGEVTLKSDWDLQYCSSGINKTKKKAQWIICICVYCYSLWAYTTWVLLQRQLMVITYYTWSHLSPVEILYCTWGLNSRIHWLQLISWYQWAWALQLAFYMKACWSLILFHWNGNIIISIIINQNHHNNNNIKNIQIMDTEVIQNTLR